MLSECPSDYCHNWERQAGDQWGKQKGAVGLAKPAEVTERGFLEEGVNAMVQRATMWAEGSECSQGIKRDVDTLESHGIRELIFPSIWCVQWVGPLQGRDREKALEYSSPAWPEVMGGLPCQILDFGPWCPISPLKGPALSLQVWLETCLVLQLL